MNEQIGGFQVGTFFGEVFDGIAAIAQDDGVGINESNFADAGSSVIERWIVAHHAEIGGAAFNLAQVGGADGVVHDRYFVILTGAIVGNGQRFAGYGGTL